MENIIITVLLILVLSFLFNWITLPYKINDTNKLLKEILELLKESR